MSAIGMLFHDGIAIHVMKIALDKTTIAVIEAGGTKIASGHIQGSQRITAAGIAPATKDTAPMAATDLQKSQFAS